MKNSIAEVFKQEGLYDRVDDICERLTKRYVEDDFISDNQYDYLKKELMDVKKEYTPCEMIQLSGELIGLAEAVFGWRYWSETLYDSIMNLGKKIYVITLEYMRNSI